MNAEEHAKGSDKFESTQCIRKTKKEKHKLLLLLLGESVTCCMCANDDLEFTAVPSHSRNECVTGVGAVACLRLAALLLDIILFPCSPTPCVREYILFHCVFVPCRRFEISSFLRQFKMCRSTCRLTYIFHSRIEPKKIDIARHTSASQLKSMGKNDTGSNYPKIYLKFQWIL